MGVYLAVLDIVVSSIFVLASTEKPIHFLSKKFTGEEPYYTKLENLELALVYTIGKLQYYF